MAFRRPLYVEDSGHLREMSDDQINKLRALATWKYAETNNLKFSDTFTISDTRLEAGKMVAHNYAYIAESGTPDISTVTVNTLAPTSSIKTEIAAPHDTGYTYPVYFDGSDIKAMSQEDFFDTIISGAIEMLTSSEPSSTTHGTYEVRGFSGTYSSIPAVSGYTGIQLVSIDTRADLTKYDTIPEELDQYESITSYYLYRKNRSNTPAEYTAPVFATSTGNLRAFTHNDNELNTALSLIFNATTSITGSRIKYDWEPGGRARGTVLDTTHDGSGKYVTSHYGSTYAYHSQEWPNGEVITANTYTFKIRLF